MVISRHSMNAPHHIQQKSLDLSVIVPFLNERENLPQFHDELLSILTETGKSFEIIYVDDGSTDGGTKMVEGLARRDNRVRLIEFMRNFGQTAAMAAGFAHARGRIYIGMDADNQNDPADIPRLLAKLEEGCDVVSGWRKRRKDSFFTRKLPSKIANRILSRVTGVRLHDYGCSLKAYRAEFIDSISLYGEMHRFLPALAQMAGAKVREMEVGHRPRMRGCSKYGMIRIFKVLIDLATVTFLSRYATKPGYLFGGVGVFLCTGGIASAAEVIIEKIAIGTYAHNNPFLLLAVFLFFLGVQFVLMGLLAELLVRTYHESQGKPVYLVRRIVG